MDWFKIDKNGLKALLAGRPIGHILRELLSNAIDENVTDVLVTLQQGDRRGTIVVEDDSPEGFRDLTEAFTLFAPSGKTSDPTKRGRFNLGEKLVIALCDEAEIVSTKGGVRFDTQGRHALRKKRERGTVFTGCFRLSRPDFEQALADLRQVIPPVGVSITINGVLLPERTPVRTFEVALPTVLADAEGILRQTRRKTTVSLYEATHGEPASIYEMGIPVVETGDKWHYDIGQKVPLNADRDNVTPAYLRELRTAVLNATHSELEAEDASEHWVREASSDPRVSDESVHSVVEKRYGHNRVSRDMSDPEANALAFSKGYAVVEGGSHSAGEWANFRRAGAILPAGKVTPSPRPYSDDPNAPKEEIVQPTERMAVVGEYAAKLGERLLGREISVRFVRAATNFTACFGRCELTFNLTVLDESWFNEINEETDKLLIHEFAHHFESSHLSANYHNALCRLGARLKRLALEDPEFFGANVPGVG